MTNPEPININELKRLLIEVLGKVLDSVDVIGYPWSMSKDELKKSVTRQIENAILDGDDS
ncbi:hypothetical protein KNV00_gp024 [Streptomyces phage Bmoc]|uniref:Uncharacterized protein n=1 Tax=Streptomyces phage Bmoc TaxID=2725629 RepID=A0A6M3TAQ1_9CAUD|nr:hypothetical protein KNV00_gp024 [Streptomyces phage Bmoc]QJD50774.1 hypothetical protein SEA_BMOC_24 [Streptomyces phage Bmoc]